jgi:hypothetical protein
VLNGISDHSQRPKNQGSTIERFNEDRHEVLRTAMPQDHNRKMFNTIKEDLAQLRRGKSGSRFSDFYDFRQSRRSPGLSVSRVLTILLGLGLTVGGASIGWLPGPGGFVAIVGLALLAQEFRPMAKTLDWCEPTLRALWQRVVHTWRQMSSSSRVAVAMTIVLTGASVGYAAYSMLLR